MSRDPRHAIEKLTEMLDGVTNVADDSSFRHPILAAKATHTAHGKEGFKGCKNRGSASARL